MRIDKLRFWSQKVLPLIYDDSLSYYEDVNKMRYKINEIIDYLDDTTIKVADPILWNITSQYESNTIVVDNVGNGYISRQPVSSGISLTDEAYWTPIFNLTSITDAIKDGIAFDNGSSATATRAFEKDDLIWWNNAIYKVLADLAVGSALLVGVNVEGYSVNMRIQELAEMIENPTGAPVTEISVTKYGAVGDGVTNDYNAIASAIAYGNENNVGVVFEYGKTYKIDGEPIMVDCPINFNNSTIVMNDRTTNMFIVGEETDSFTISCDATTESNIGNSALYNKGFFLLTDVSMGVRQGGSGGEFFYGQYLMTDDYGNFINTPLKVGYGAGHTATVMNMQDYNVENLRIHNVKLSYPSSNSNAQPFILVYRPNVTIDNVIIDSGIILSSNQGHVVEGLYTGRLTIKNVSGSNVSQDESHASYIALLYGCSNILMEDFDTSCGWGNTGMSFVTNIMGNRLNVNRLDIHYGHNGYVVFNSCSCGGNLGFASIGMGFAQLTFNNCTFMASDTYNWCVMFRNDFGIPARGLIFNHCTFNKRSNNAVVFQVNRPQAATEIANFDIPDMLVLFNGCNNYCDYYFNCTLASDPITPLIKLIISNATHINNRRFCANSQAVDSITLSNVQVTGNGATYANSFSNNAAKLVRVSNCKINLAIGANATYDAIYIGCHIVSVSPSATTGAIIVSGCVVENGYTFNNVNGAKGKMITDNIIKSA